MEVFFVDVAQGTSNVVLLGGRRAIVIDCGGGQAETLLALLDRLRIDTLPRLVVSHSHADHSRGAAAVLTAFQGRVEQVWLLEDACRSDSLFWQRVREELEASRLGRQQVRRLERDEAPRSIYWDERIRLSLIAPDVVTNLQAIDDQEPNATSAVLVLGNGSQQVVFAGDSTLATWHDIHSRISRPVTCAVCAIPHHAGGVWERQRPGESRAAYEARIPGDLDWFYTQAIRAEYGIISVGTSNTYRHPRPEVLEAMLRGGVLPICTQMTRQCSDDLEGQRRRSLPLVHPSRSSSTRDTTDSGRSRNVPCAGTILVEIDDGATRIQRLADHQAMVGRMAALPGGSPLCRADSA